MKKSFFLILMITTIILTSACYRVNEYKFLNIGFRESRINSFFLKKYIDNVRNKNLIVAESVNEIFLFGNPLGDNERIIYFKNFPEEWYMISFDAAPCWIEYVYNKRLSSTSINDADFLGDSQLKRIQIRFRNEVLKPVEEYGKRNHFADSIIYNTKFK